MDPRASEFLAAGARAREVGPTTQVLDGKETSRRGLEIVLKAAMLAGLTIGISYAAPAQAQGIHMIEPDAVVAMPIAPEAGLRPLAAEATRNPIAAEPARHPIQAEASRYSLAPQATQNPIAAQATRNPLTAEAHRTPLAPEEKFHFVRPDPEGPCYQLEAEAPRYQLASEVIPAPGASPSKAKAAAPKRGPAMAP